jgi:cytosine/creatinine deaminase
LALLKAREASISQQFRHDLGASLSRRGFLGRLGATGLAAASAPSLLTDEVSAVQTGSETPTNVTGIAQVRLRGKTGLWNVEIRDARIRRISQQPLTGPTVINGGGKLLTEGLVEHHLHMDKALSEDRLKWDEASLKADQQNYDDTQFRGFIFFRESLLNEATFTEGDVFDRAMRMARMESSSGTTAIRSHAIVDEVRGLNCIKGLVRARQAMRPFMDLQISIYPQDNSRRSILLQRPQVVDLVRRGMQAGADGVGGIPELDWDHASDYIDLVFRLATETGGFVDLHIDQLEGARANKFSHPIIVAKTRQYGMQGRVTASHSYSLAYQPAESVLSVLDQMRDLGVDLSCSPDRFGKERVQIPRSHGVLVALHSDNVRDPLIRGGSGNLIEAADIYRRQMGIDSDEGLDAIFDLITTCPGQGIGLKDYGLHEGGRADLVLWDADSVAHVILHEARPSYVLKGGKVVIQRGRDTNPSE